ncbi:MAG: DNA repair protein RecN [Lachnospiraceae bacterium]|nr:DNA repair protein RecN [Lachnospiraceae bacterium]
MLSNVHVKNFALIDEADIGLAGNLNVLTGETGAGKSILLGAVNLALGARTSREVIRSGCDFALAELTFTGIGARAAAAAEELGIDISDDEIVISRKLMTNGKSIVRINGETMNAAAARSITAELIDIYGQNEHQSLTDTAKHLEIIDRMLGAEASGLKDLIAGEYAEYSSIRDELDGLENDPALRPREIDRLKAEIDEIERAELKEGEEESLKAERKVLANAELITEALGGACGYLYNDDGVSDMLSAAIKALGRVGELDENLSGYLDELSEIDSRVSDVYREMEDYLGAMPESGERLNEVDERLDLIARLKHKFGSTVDGIYAFCDSNKERLAKLTEFESYVDGLEKRLEAAGAKCRQHSLELSKLRKQTAAVLKDQITEALKDLNFNKVVFDISFTEREELHADGMDRAEFLISLNPGEEPRSLNKIASGGEMSRIMLAIKSVFARRETIGTLIFDEIDTGISGITAQKVADKLCAIAEEHQVICITHLPQIAAMADSHFCVTKSAFDDSTKVSVDILDESGILNELGRILGGENPSESVLEAAADIRNDAAARKTEIRKANNIKI